MSDKDEMRKKVPVTSGDDYPPGGNERGGSSASGPSRPFSEHLKAAAAYTSLITMFMAGFGVAAAIWSSSMSPIQADLTRAREERDRLTLELEQVKTEYAQYRARPAQSNPAGEVHSAPETAEKEATSERLTIGHDSTATAFGGDLFISVHATPFEGTPLRHTVVGTVGSSGVPSIAIDHKPVGYALTIKGAKRYEVRIVQVDTFTATFLATVLK